ncbi:MAG: 1,6-anhydro-N-acetylmuramyl-L-alanine amidase AmpD [Gammaproteobacteria bacterium]|nr:1,6-anhydro-N-acetylmuramyl-L-alanine amidase AmpD [Gammaproteobacteria bacterium]MDD2929118.1 1,6-anhydro-N-acetylmuramyl-L-alanine amidase AmpD [Sideroxydans sp.]MDD5470891.1 1,6-anhydro-N-acetylmuramyl-L-alanine amidase AmpD [Sideroxydans sp.]
MKFDASGWISGVRRIASPNFDARPAGTPVSLLVIHSISLPPGQFGGSGIRNLFTNTLDCSAHAYYAQLEGLRVSAHFLIARDGSITQFVSCRSRAWHAGVSMWQGRERCNDFSIGIELEGCDSVPFEPQQYAALFRLTRRLQRNYPIRHIAGHADIAPGRKTDPGPTFDWGHYFSLLGRSSA